MKADMESIHSIRQRNEFESVIKPRVVKDKATATHHWVEKTTKSRI